MNFERQKRIVGVLEDARLQYSERVTVAWFIATNDWHTIKETGVALGLGKTLVGNTLITLHKKGYLQRKKNGVLFVYAVTA